MKAEGVKRFTTEVVQFEASKALVELTKFPGLNELDQSLRLYLVRIFRDLYDLDLIEARDVVYSMIGGKGYGQVTVEPVPEEGLTSRRVVVTLVRPPKPIEEGGEE